MEFTVKSLFKDILTHISVGDPEWALLFQTRSAPDNSPSCQDLITITGGTAP